MKTIDINKILFLKCLLCLITQLLVAQDVIKVKGIVTDSETGEPLIGANVIIHETGEGTVTNYEGNYKLIGLTKNTVLQFSFLGYEEYTITVGERTIIDVQLNPALENLESVVIFGENQKDFRSITGSVDRVDASVFSSGTPSASFEQLLQGQVSGLAVQVNGEPGEPSQLRIRGNNSLGVRSVDEKLSTFNTANEPLYILNGIPISSEIFSTINPYDIIEVKVLKDGLSTVEYGTRGANGVIEIYTKRGIIGKTNYNVRYNHTIRPIGGLGGISLMDSREKLALEKELEITNGFGYIYSPKAGDLLPVKEYKEEKYKELEDINTNWLKELSRVGHVKDLQMSMSGGVYGTRYFTSANYFEEEGGYENSWAKRFSTRFSLDHNLNDNFSLGVDVSVARSQRSKSLTSPARLIYTLQPYETPSDTSFIARNTNNGGVNFKNPFDELFNNYRKNIHWRSNINPKVTYRIRDTKIKLEYGLAYREGENTTVSLPNDQGVTDRQKSGKISKNKSSFMRNRVNLSYELRKTLDKHTLFVNLGGEYINNQNRSFGYLSNGISEKVDPSIGANPQATINNTKYEDALIGLAGKFSYSYLSKYDIVGSIRFDGSSILPKGEQFVGAYGVGIAWDLRGENFMASSSVFDLLKFRFSYGLNFNSGGIRQTLGLPYYDFTNNDIYRGQRMINLVEFYNPDLRFEKTKQWSTAIDFSIFKKRIYGTIESYVKQTDDLLSNINIPTSNGFGSLLQNIGSLENRGIEISFNGVPIRTNHFRWTTRINLAYNVNKVTDLKGQDQIQVGTEGLFKLGEPINSAFVKHWGGVNSLNGQPVFYTENRGLVLDNNAPQLVGFGAYDHPFVGGFTNVINYKDLEISLLLSYGIGGVNYNKLKSRMIQNTKNGEVPFRGFLGQIWLNPGDVKPYPYPKFFSSNTPNSIFLEDASYLRVKNVTIRYNLQQYFKLKNTGNIMLTVQGNNLFTFTKYEGIDPEVTGIGQPLLPSYTLGIDVTF
ncbi:SusC/RagA family TonB-linked outer membrane protein (plasmid) [Flammeovirga sp. MY04]|uniref:SusC/RagA family TonB-linked outer membrane protein n=1 Tax=Flammeovirga sp. MY04 TaxID=1191459 RepID=UPI0008060D1B|nr:SusC/RagA family TonB-linked outer membrane protein [Flammeovirga sp. MY04]ANQ52877.1 SusC/RagA family TonB-linked outer membrane protein [Flammeovirga sp. MY04]